MSTEQKIEVVGDLIPKFKTMTDEEWYGVSTEEVLKIREWLETRRLEGQRIDPETAEVTFWWTEVLDPYGVNATMPERFRCVGRSYFACAPGSRIWVCFDDLPEQTTNRLWERISSGEISLDIPWPALIECWSLEG